jgi:hypothetical protein
MNRTLPLLLASALAIGADGAFANEVVLDGEAAGENGDIAPTLRLRSDGKRIVSIEEPTVYGSDQMWRAMGYMPATPEHDDSRSPVQEEVMLQVPIRSRGATSMDQDPESNAAPDPEATRLEGITVVGTRQEIWGGDVRMQKLIQSTPCMGCDGVIAGPSPSVRLAIDVGMTLLRGFFIQPRARGESNDEALHFAQRTRYQDQLP